MHAVTCTEQEQARCGTGDIDGEEERNGAHQSCATSVHLQA